MAHELVTFDVRAARANDNAGQLAIFLAAKLGEAHVYYPGLPAHRNHELARHMFTRHPGTFGSMITADVPAGYDLDKLIRALQPTVTCRLTLGDAATTVLPVQSVFGKDYGLGMLRISVGIEPIDVLLKAFRVALEGAGR